MKRVVTFGRQPETAPPGTLRPIHFPQLALLDQGTNEGLMSRILTSEGGDSRSLPRTIYFQKTQTPGHMGSVAIGAVYEVTLDGETGVLSGKGWLADVPEAHDAIPFILSKALFHNSVDLAEVKAHYEEHGDWFDDDFHVDVVFDEWKYAATTFVGKPAFGDAHGELPDEIMAALEDDSPIVVSPDVPIKIGLEVTADDSEVVAGATGLPPWDYFHIPEADTPTKIIVGEADENGWIPVFGHLARWNTCHDGIDARCTTVPRPTDNYASFNKPGPLTDRGQVETGPLCLKGGHVPLAKALDDVKNAWADVRIVPGVHGPWLSGVVRPGVDPDDVYTARCSRISGHWKGGRLKAIVSVNAEGFDVPGSGFSFATNEEGEITDLVASFVPDCTETKDKTIPPALLGELSKLTEPNEKIIAALKALIAQQNSVAAPGPKFSFSSPTYTSEIAVDTTTNKIVFTNPTMPPPEPVFDVELERAKRKRKASLTQS